MTVVKVGLLIILLFLHGQFRERTTRADHNEDDENESVSNNRMASGIQSDEEILTGIESESESESESWSESESGSEFEAETDSDVSDEVDVGGVVLLDEIEVVEGVPCKFYNSGSCRDGNSCLYLHICKYVLKGKCRRGAHCKLSHTDARTSSGGGNGASGRSASRHGEERTAPKLTDGRHYQWQLNNGNGWMDIDNDHIIEAQYSLPHTKSIKIYNTPYGAVSIDFKRMKVYGKNLRVRRLDDGNTEWIWYCTLRRKWNKYGEKDAKGNPSPVKSSEIEKKYQSNPKSSYTFSVGTKTIEIRFRDMQQVSQKRKRKVTRRPRYRQQQTGAGAASAFQNLSVGTKPQWQFEGDSGAWHVFKPRRGTSTECSVTSDDIERVYQQNNRSGSMSFRVNGSPYNLDFGAMIQIHLTTKHKRRVRRVLV